MIRAFGASLARLCAASEAEPERQDELRQEVLLALWLNRRAAADLRASLEELPEGV